MLVGLGPKLKHTTQTNQHAANPSYIKSHAFQAEHVNEIPEFNGQILKFNYISRIET